MQMLYIFLLLAVIGSMFGGTTGIPVANPEERDIESVVLDFAKGLEYLEGEFYKNALETVDPVIKGTGEIISQELGNTIIIPTKLASKILGPDLSYLASIPKTILDPVIKGTGNIILQESGNTIIISAKLVSKILGPDLRYLVSIPETISDPVIKGT